MDQTTLLHLQGSADPLNVSILTSQWPLYINPVPLSPSDARPPPSSPLLVPGNNTLAAIPLGNDNLASSAPSVIDDGAPGLYRTLYPSRYLGELADALSQLDVGDGSTLDDAQVRALVHSSALVSTCEACRALQDLPIYQLISYNSSRNSYAAVLVHNLLEHHNSSYMLKPCIHLCRLLCLSSFKCMVSIDTMSWQTAVAHCSPTQLLTTWSLQTTARDCLLLPAG